ncbi:uncharacterized protein [Antedon mediterranea]|uniref:uncharacterized protein n=1 Tax=Antedon mediterranea TaxID=105859 RepID=UPI003AF6D4E7
MTKVPESISPNISRLNLFGNNIKLLENRSMAKYRVLRKLSLADNDIADVDVNAFQGLADLQKLYLSENKIKRIPDGVFMPLTNLEWLMMDHNELTTFEGNSFAGLHNLYWLSIRHNKINDPNIGNVFENLPSLEWLELDNNRITTLNSDSFSGDTSLSTLSLKNNEISFVHPLALTSLVNLVELDLSKNRIDRLSSVQFKNLTKLSHLSLDFNLFRSFPVDVFYDLVDLEILRLEGITINNIKPAMFENLKKLTTVYFSSFQYCSYVPHVRNCNPKTDGISTIYNLMANRILRVSVWTMATLTFVGNLGVFISRLLMKAEHKVYSLFIMNLCAADFLMSIYLFIIAVQDHRFRDNYNQNARQWMDSIGCKMTGFLAMVSSEVSVLLLALISVERFVCIVYPYECRRLKKKKATIIISSIWTTCALIACVPMFVQSYFGNFYGTNGVCFPLHIHEPRLKGWEYSAAIFLGINLLALVLIIVSYVGMFMSIRTTRNASTVQIGYKGDMKYARRFFFIVLTDSLCWIPIVIIKLIALFNIPITENLYTWIVIFVLPVNSALNPILYTISTTTFTQWFMKALKLHVTTQNYVTKRAKKSHIETNKENTADMSDRVLSSTRPSLQTNCSELLPNTTSADEDAAEPQIHLDTRCYVEPPTSITASYVTCV